MDAVFEDLREGERLKVKGINEANGNADPGWAKRFDLIASHLANRGLPFTSEDVTRLVGQPDHPNRVGARMNALARKNVIRRVDFVKARRSNQHAALISIWVGTGELS